MRTSPRSLIAAAGIGVALLAFTAGCSSDAVTAPAGPAAPARVFTSLELTPSSFTLFTTTLSTTFEPLKTVQLSTVAKDQSGAEMIGGSLSFSSSEPSVAAVDAGGLVSAVAPGEADISASVTIKGVTKTTTAVITVSASPDQILIYAGVDARGDTVKVFTSIFPYLPGTVVTANGVQLTRCYTDDPYRRAYGTYCGTLYPAAAAGSSVNLAVRADGVIVDAIGIVPEAPVLVTPDAGTMFSLADSVTVVWSSATDPVGFEVVFFCCEGWGYEVRLSDGTARELKAAARDIGSGDWGIWVEAMNEGSFIGPVDPASRMRILGYGSQSATRITIGR